MTWPESVDPFSPRQQRFEATKNGYNGAIIRIIYWVVWLQEPPPNAHDDEAWLERIGINN